MKRANIAIDSQLAYEYDSSRHLAFSGTENDEPGNGGIGVIFNTNDFLLQIFDFPTAPRPIFYYSQVGMDRVVGANLVSLDVHVVPLPPSVFLLGSGLLGLAGWRRFRKG
jgi:hypothetical protein